MMAITLVMTAMTRKAVKTRRAGEKVAVTMMLVVIGTMIMVMVILE